MAAAASARRWLIAIHRWVGVVLCLLFMVWFPSAIGMMYWDFPEVTAADRLAHSASLDASSVKLSPAEAYTSLAGQPPIADIRLNTFAGRPVYRFRGRGSEMLVYADTGEVRADVTTEMVSRIASTWTRQPAAAARIELVQDVDQWTVQSGVRRVQPLWKYSWPDGQQVYVSQRSGEVEQYTTTASRLGAYLGPIPHWLYFTPFRKHPESWSRFVIWSSGIGTATAILGIVIGLWMYSPSKRYRFNQVTTSIPYRGVKRWHAICGLIFGIGAVTWAFSGMLSMEPFPLRRASADDRSASTVDIPRALRGRTSLDAFETKQPVTALLQLNGLHVQQLEFTAFAGEPVYLATLIDGETRIVPVNGEPVVGFDPARIMNVLRDAAQSSGGVDLSLLQQYDRYYLDRRRERPLPVVVAQLHNADRTRVYINPKTARVVAVYESPEWISRWLYHALHSLDFPWLYNHRPLWDIVVITFMTGGTALSLTSLILAWRVLGRKLRRSSADLAVADDLYIDHERSAIP
jgi:hypothetical protein